MDLVKPYNSLGIVKNDLLNSVTKASVFEKDFQNEKRQYPNKEMEKNRNLAYDNGDMDKNTWRQMNGTIRQEYTYIPIFNNRYYDVLNENYEKKTPHFLNNFENRIETVSGFEYKAKDIPIRVVKTQRQY